LSDNVESLKVEIVKPEQGYIYLNGRELFPLFFITLIIGPFTFEVNVSGDNPINKVEFYIDNQLKHTDYYEPYSWECYEILSFSHTLKAKAYNIYEDHDSNEIKLLFFNTRTRPIDDLKPEPYITNPSNDWSLYGNSWDVTTVHSDIIQVVAVELQLASDIISTSFEYSSDEENWLLIGIDNDTSFEGEWFGVEGGVRNGIGISGWNIDWNISTLNEGFYFIRAMMIDENSQTGQYQRKIYYDPSPPIAQIYEPVYGAEISGFTEFKVNSSDEDIVYLELEFFNGSGNTVTQKNLGDVSQYDVGPNTDGTRRFDGDNNFCGPTSVANGLCRLAKKNPKLKQMGGKTLSNVSLAKLLAKKMAPTIKGDDKAKTKGLKDMQRNGVATDDLKKGVEDYLKEIGLGCDNKTHGYSVKGIKNPTWADYERELKAGQCVILLIAPIGKTSGHYVTGKSANKNKNNDGTHDLGVVDSQNAWSAKDASAKWGTKNNIKFKGKDQKVLYMLVICPKRKVDIPKDTFVSIEPTGANNRDYISNDGWSVDWDTTIVHDGFFLVRGNLIDEVGNTGTDLINTYVNNKIPYPSIITPNDGAVVNGIINIEVIDLLYSEDIVYTTFEYFDEFDWIEIETDTDYLDGWKIEWDTTKYEDGKYLIRATTVDYSEKTGEDVILVIVDNIEDEDSPIVVITGPLDGDYVTSPLSIYGYATDEDTGIALLDYKFVWAGGYIDGYPEYIDPPLEYFTFILGPIYLEQYIEPGDWITIITNATDDAGNIGEDSVTVTWVEEEEDTTPPVTKKTIGEPQWEGGYTIASFTPIWLEATDPEPGSGVNYIHYEVWQDGIMMGSEDIPGDYVEMMFGMYGVLYGIAEIRWYAVDNANNIELMHYQEHFILY
jgi:hypothetical protein